MTSTTQGGLPTLHYHNVIKQNLKSGSQAYVGGTTYTLSDTKLILLIDHHDLNALEGVDNASPLLSCFYNKLCYNIKMISINDFYDLVMPRLKNIPHIIYNGTLWSIAQEYDLHVDDIDIDLLFPIECQNQIREEFSDFDVLRDDEYHLWLEFEGRRLDCYLYKDCGNYISEASSYIIMADDRGIDPEKLSMHWDKDLIFPTQTVVYRDIVVQLPAKPFEMLEKHFGKNWQKWETPFTATNIGKVEIHRTVFDHKTKLVYSHKNTPYYFDKDGVRYSHLPTKPDS